MDIKRETKNMIRYGLKSEANRKEAIKRALIVIETLNKYSELTPKGLSQIIGGATTFAGVCGK